MINEDALEQLAIQWFKEEGYSYYYGKTLGIGDGGQRQRSSDVLLLEPLREALQRINPHVPASAIEDVIHKIQTLSHPVTVKANMEFHSCLREGVAVSYTKDGETQHDTVRCIDFHKPENNIFWVVNQLCIAGSKCNRVPDIIVYVNGLPLGLIELKSPVKEHVGVTEAFNQLQTYMHEITGLAIFNEALVASDGIQARIGSLTASKEWFLPWRYCKAEDAPCPFGYELETVVRGFFDRTLFLEYIRDFVLYEPEDKGIIKKIASYHQFHGVREAVRAVVHAANPDADKEAKGRGGVIWHTQGSGKSISMCCLAGKLLSHPQLANPTLVVVTDRNDLDGQLFETFCKAQNLLSDMPVQANDRASLRSILQQRPSGGIIFTTIQKFSLTDDETTFPVLSDRHNIIVIADECHRSQYGFSTHYDQKRKAFVAGYALHMRHALPHATFTGFTGTPISEEDRDTQAVFGGYVSIYDIEQAQKDGATVPLYYESRLAKLSLKEEELPHIDDAVEELTEDEEITQAEKNKGRWAALEKLVGAEPRLQQVAADLVEHFEARLKNLEGKAMIVCMSRAICARMFDALVALRPDWAGTRLEDGSYDPSDGALRVIMTAAASDPQEMQAHNYSKKQKKELEKRFKKADDSLKLVIVRDMWLTGFDVPAAHTIYIDKPIHGHNLMQAIARVNRVFKGKPGGLVVDYIGIANELKKALHTYTQGGRGGRPTIDVNEALLVMEGKLQEVRDLFHGFDYTAYETKAVELLPAAANFLVGLQGYENPKKYFFDCMLVLTKAQALCGTLDKAVTLRDEIAFFQAVKLFIFKTAVTQTSSQDKDGILRQLVANALVPDGVEDVFALAGLEKPDISILSDEFLDDIRAMPYRNLAVELLEKLLKDQISSRLKQNNVQRRKFSERLKESVTKYQNRAIETSQVIEALIQMAKDLNEAGRQGERLNLSPDEYAFYTALEDNESAAREMSDEALKAIACELTQKIRKSATIDWPHKSSVQAKMRNIVRTILKRYKYPPDAQAKAVEEVLRQAETLADAWTREDI